MLARRCAVVASFDALGKLLVCHDLPRMKRAGICAPPYYFSGVGSVAEGGEVPSPCSWPGIVVPSGMVCSPSVLSGGGALSFGGSMVVAGAGDSASSWEPPHPNRLATEKATLEIAIPACKRLITGSSFARDEHFCSKSWMGRGCLVLGVKLRLPVNRAGARGNAHQLGV
jgi:hypothetical protein